MSEELPLPPNSITCLKKLISSPIIQRCIWNVYAYVINQDVIDENNKIDDLRAYVIPLGSFTNDKKADKYIKKLIEATGYKHIVMAESGMLIPITVSPDSTVINKITVDTKNQLIQMEKDENKKQRENYEKQLKYLNELKQEYENECDVDHFDYFKRHAYLASLHYLNLLSLDREKTTVLKHYNNHKQLLQEHDLKYPEHKKLFLSEFKKLLLQRGEDLLYQKIEYAYQQCQNDLFNV
jgi:hypothetical protein